MGQYNNPDFLFSFDLPSVPMMAPASGRAKLWEMEEDNAYLNYLYPQVTRQIREFTEETCDKLEYEGSLMFDVYPDKTTLRLMAGEILADFRKKYPDAYKTEPSNENAPASGNNTASENSATENNRDDMLRDMIEVVLFHEIMYRRNRYRNHKRLYL